MKKFGKTIGKKLMILAMSAILVGGTAGFVTPVMATAPEGGTGGTAGSEAITTGKDTDIILTGVNAPNATITNKAKFATEIERVRERTTCRLPNLEENQ